MKSLNEVVDLECLLTKIKNTIGEEEVFVCSRRECHGIAIGSPIIGKFVQMILESLPVTFFDFERNRFRSVDVEGSENYLYVFYFFEIAVQEHIFFGKVPFFA